MLLTDVPKKLDHFAIEDPTESAVLLTGMKKPRYTDQQIAQALRQAEQGPPVAELCRKLGVSETTFYHWKKR